MAYTLLPQQIGIMEKTNYFYFQKKISATRALLKFCVDHNRQSDGYVESVRSCLAALEQQDIDTALSHYKSIPLGDGPMRFNDWWIPCVLESETPEYVATVFEALTDYWDWAMKLSLFKECPICRKEIPCTALCPSCYLKTTP
jgi:hypothetical protein